MPKASAKKRCKKRALKEQVDDTESESGKLSETQEVAKRLSRTLLGKENTKRCLRSNSQKGPTDPYDADSEVESDVNSQTDSKQSLTPMAIDTYHEPSPMSSLPRVLQPKTSKLFYSDHSTPATMTPGRSDDSLFGFASAMDSPLPFSPVGLASPTHSETNSLYSESSSSVMSPSKRKLQLHIFDMPLEKQSKKIKKKKNITSRQDLDDVIHDVMSEFQEVEMFSLGIE